MTPVAHWSEADYYRASRRARAAWEATQPQLTMFPAGGSAVGQKNLSIGQPGRSKIMDAALAALGESGLEGADAGTTSLVASAPSSPPSPHADAARTSGSHSSGRGEGGLDS